MPGDAGQVPGRPRKRGGAAMTLEARRAEGPPGPLPYAAALALVLLLHLFFRSAA